MQQLSPRVNVIPVIGKADSLTPTELRAFKQRVNHYADGTVTLLTFYRS